MLGLALSFVHGSFGELQSMDTTQIEVIKAFRYVKDRVTKFSTYSSEFESSLM